MLLNALRARSRSVGDVLRSLEAVVSEHWSESPHLEFKEALPRAGDKDEHREFARDVVAFANEAGGVIVFGIREDGNEHADSFTPVSLGKEATSLGHVLDQLVDPPLRCVNPMAVPRSGTDVGAYVIEVLPSPRAPHAVHEKSGALSYWRRSGRGKRVLTESEVARAYQDRWESARSLSDRAAQVRRLLRERYRSPVFWISVVPCDVREHVFRPDQATLDRFRSLADYHYGALGSGGVGYIPPDVRVRFRRVEFAPCWTDESERTAGWMMFGDQGQFLGVCPLREGLFSENGVLIPGGSGSHMRYLTEMFLVERLLTRLIGLRRLADEFGVWGEAFIACGLYDPEGGPLAFVNGESIVGRSEHHNPLEVEDSRSVTFADLYDGPGLVKIAKSLLDPLVTHFGWPECRMLTDEGGLRRSAIPNSSLDRAGKWAREYGVPVI